ncbi:hypothetical protein X801_08574, partial [Opisthorchis viverrini]
MFLVTHLLRSDNRVDRHTSKRKYKKPHQKALQTPGFLPQVGNPLRHMFYQRERERLENERFAALPRWRFSIQPRPRGSSLFLRSSTEREATGELGTFMSSESGAATPISSLHCSNPHGELEVQAHIIPQVSSEHSGPITPKLVVSVALSTVPEVTEEYTHPSTEHGSPNM